MKNQLEKELGYAIPNDLNKLLSDDSNRYSGLEYVRILSDGYKYEDGIVSFSTYESFCKDNEYRDFLDDFQEQFELNKEYVDSQFLYIIGETNGGSVCMSLYGTHQGKVYIADNGDFGITLQSESLKGFIDSLYKDDYGEVCSYDEIKRCVIEKDLPHLKKLIENKGGDLILQRSSYNDIEVFDLAYKNKDFDTLNYLMSKGFYGFNRVEKYGLIG